MGENFLASSAFVAAPASDAKIEANKVSTAIIRDIRGAFLGFKVKNAVW